MGVSRLKKQNYGRKKSLYYAKKLQSNKVSFLKRIRKNIHNKNDLFQKLSLATEVSFYIVGICIGSFTLMFLIVLWAIFSIFGDIDVAVLSAAIISALISTVMYLTVYIGMKLFSWELNRKNADSIKHLFWIIVIILFLASVFITIFAK